MFLSRGSRLLTLALASLLLALGFFPGRLSQVGLTIAQDGKVEGEVIQALQADETVPVIVTLNLPQAEVQAAGVPASVAGAQAEVLSEVPAGDLEVYQQYSHVPAFAGLADAEAIAALQADPRVAYVQVDERTSAHLGQSVIALQANVVHSNYNLTGQGVRVAVLDSGIDTDHPDLVSDLVAQRCFASGNIPSGGTTGACPGGVAQSASAEDQNGHGSNVAGIITSDGVVGSIGFAPDAEIVAVRVLDANGSGWVSDWIAGMNWIVANQGTLHVDVINMSLGTNLLYIGNCDPQFPPVATAVTQLRALGISIFASTGNQGSNSSLASPACNSGVIGVGATYDSNLGAEPDTGTYNSLFGGNWPPCFDAATSLNTVTCFTNSNNLMDMLAPGARITSDYLNGGLATFRGTSQASPTAAGIAALLVQGDPTLTPDEVETTLESTGTMVTDGKNGLQFPSINALTAVQSLPPPTPNLLTPAAGLITDRRPTFTWSGSLLATQQEIEIQFGANPPSTTLLDGGVTSYRPPDALEFGTYTWRVRAHNDTKVSDWSPPRATIIGSLPNVAPTPNNPLDDTPTLTWNRVTGATEYLVEVATTSSFGTSIVFTATLNADTLEVEVSPALEDGPYYWHVCARKSGSTLCTWGATQTFYVG
jgi:subtilisin family serine protease